MTLSEQFRKINIHLQPHYNLKYEMFSNKLLRVLRVLISVPAEIFKVGFIFFSQVFSHFFGYSIGPRAASFPLLPTPRGQAFPRAPAFAAWAHWNSYCSWAKVSLYCSDSRSRSQNWDSYRLISAVI